ncbi:Adenosine monophosphate-protein transferase FICD-like protein, partial [Stegodyphus mimosarum]
MNNCKSEKIVCVFSISFTLAFACLIILASVLYFKQPLYCTNKIHNDLSDESEKPKYELKPYVPKFSQDEVKIVPNFLPDYNEIEPCEELIRIEDVPKIWSIKTKNEGTEQEALTAVNMALKMKNSHKLDKARKLFQHALALQPHHPDVLNHYGEFLEEKERDIIKADHLYVRALTVSPRHTRALSNRQRTLPVVNELDDQELERIDAKRTNLMQLNNKDPAQKRVRKELYFQHIYHTVAIEGNTMTLGEARQVVETRMAVAGKSIMEHNEILGLESALKFVNKSLVNKGTYITVYDILEIHKRVLGFVDPLEAGTFRKTQVFVGEHSPPPASHVPSLVQDLVEWLQSETQLHPVKKAALAHYKLVYIHPFVDGNGRTARLLMNLILMQAGFPPIIIHKQDRAFYYNTLQLANEGDIRPFVRFIAQCTESTLDVFLYASEYSRKALESRRDQNDIIAL